MTTLHGRIQEGLRRNRDAIPLDLGSVIEPPALEGPISQQEQEDQAWDLRTSTAALPSPVESVSSSLSFGIGWASVLRIIQVVASGLVYIHDQHTVHTDLKPPQRFSPSLRFTYVRSFILRPRQTLEISRLRNSISGDLEEPQHDS